MRQLLTVVFTIVAGTLLPAVAAADVIRLKNGNTLQGEVEATNEQEVTVHIPGAGRLTLKKEEIVSIEKTSTEERSQDSSKARRADGASPASSYIKSVVISLALVEAAKVEIGKVNTEAMNNPASAAAQAALFRQAAAQYRVAGEKVDEAMGAIEPYSGSAHQWINQSTNALLHAYGVLKRLNQDTALLFDEMAQGQEDGSAEAHLTEWMKRQLEINERSSRPWDLIIEAVSQKVILAPLEVSKEGQTTGRLAMTVSERDRLIAEIDRLVPEAKQGLQAGRSKMIFGAALIRQVLLQVPPRD